MFVKILYLFQESLENQEKLFGIYKSVCHLYNLFKFFEFANTCGRQSGRASKMTRRTPMGTVICSSSRL